MHGPIPRLREAPKDVLFFERRDRESSGFSGGRLKGGPGAEAIHNGTYALESGRNISFTTGDWSFITTPRQPIQYKDAAKTFIGFDYLDVRPPAALRFLDVGRLLADVVFGPPSFFFALQEGKIVVTDRLHGIILSTLKGVPHVIFDSLLGKNKAYHDTSVAPPISCCSSADADLSESCLRLV